MAKHPAIFLDRDETIIEENGYIKNPMDIVFYAENFKALKQSQNHFLLFIITNQSGISRGITAEGEIEKVNKHLIELLKAKGIVINDLFYCPHKNGDNCLCKKPKPYFLKKTAAMDNLNLNASYISVDYASDVYCGINAGVNFINILSGHRKRHQNELSGEITACNNVLNFSN